MASTTLEASPAPLGLAGDVARRLACDKYQVYQLAREKKIPSVRIGRSIRFDLEAIELFIYQGGTSRLNPPLADANGDSPSEPLRLGRKKKSPQ